MMREGEMWASFASGFTGSIAKEIRWRDTTKCWVTVSSGGDVDLCWYVPGANHCIHEEQKQSHSHLPCQVIDFFFITTLKPILFGRS